MGKTVVDVHRDEIEAKLKQQVDSVAGGAPKDWAAYREQVGVIRGLTFALYNINDLMRTQEQDND